MSNPLYIYIYILNIYDLVWFYGISTIVGYLMPNLFYTYVLNIYDLVWLGFLKHINPCRLFNAKSSLYMYIKYIEFVKHFVDKILNKPELFFVHS